MRKKVLIGLAVWLGLLVVGAVSLGLGVWQLKSAASILRRDGIEETEVRIVANRVAWSNLLLKSARYNPAIFSARLVPGASWLPESVAAGSEVVSQVHEILSKGGQTVMASVFSRELTPQPGEIDVQEARVVADAVAALDREIVELRTVLARIENISVPFIDNERRDDTLAMLNQYVDLAESGVAAMKKFPQLLGADEPVRYFVGITNPAELRGIQGIIGEYAIVKIDNGKISVERSGSNIDLENPQKLPANLIGEYSNIYGERNTEWQNMNLSPFFDHAAAQITHAWKMQTGQLLDGVVLLDTVALAKWAIPKIGVIESAQGRRLETWEALADYLSNGIYFEFPSDQLARKEFQSTIARTLIDAVTSTAVDAKQLFKFLAKPMIDGRVVVWLNGEEGAEFNQTLLARSLGWSQNKVLIGFNNWTGNKMDFYLVAEIDWKGCETFDLKLSSVADSDIAYPDYLTRRLDADHEGDPNLGSFLDIGVALPSELELKSVQDGIEVAAFDVYPIDGNRTFVRNQIEITPGTGSTLTFNLRPKNGCLTNRIHVTPLRQDVVALSR